MNKQQKLLVFILIIVYLMIFIFTRKEELKQKLCKVKQYSYCTKNQQLKSTIRELY